MFMVVSKTVYFLFHTINLKIVIMWYGSTSKVLFCQKKLYRPVETFLNLTEKFDSKAVVSIL